MSDELKKKLADEIRQKALELNQLLGTAYDNGLQVKVDAPVGYPSRLFGFGGTSAIMVEIYNVQATKY